MSGGDGLDGDTMGARLKRFQARYESAFTRILLLGIFATGLTAQFVKPLGDALEGKASLGGALLSLVAYVLYDTVKDLKASLRLLTRPQLKSPELGRFVSEAFHSRTVEIAFLGYTGETLYNELYHRLEDILEDPGPTRRVVIRVLVPDFGLPMRVPSKVGAGGEPVDDPDYRKRLETKCREYDRTLSGLAERLTALGRVTAQCEYRLYPGIPRDKICIFNRKLVLHGLYDVTARTVMRSSDPEFYDPKGYRMDLNVWSLEGSEDAKAVVATWNRHLDGLWNLAETPSWRR
ncbi:hypothetical protein LXH13_22245 [Streptomyces spinosirectus]|jgi:hypothetical protein|uniref:hypothetical protein n=1 Tax=Streptomyces TaxID=1883 RepID=UPI001C9E0911|nr:MULTISPECIES: hypothetical protein [Streptomyces]MBY8340029.1 hypothetical protein [Streptomyces plumbidurans]UIR19589.1 hypothetical protein LXH13_22245 [Streptomyces spinosirectus]